MALTDYFTTENSVVTVNGRQITDFGQAETPISEGYIDPKRTMVRGMGGSATKLERKNNGFRVTLNLMPGSADSAFLHGLFQSGASVSYTRSQIGALDGVVASEGMVTTEGDITRGGGASVSDDTYTLEFNVYGNMRGGL